MKNTPKNILIAEFMGMHYIEDIRAFQLGTWEAFNSFPSAQASPLDSTYAIVRELQYDSSWEWLMLVVDKIEGMFRTGTPFQYPNPQIHFNSVKFQITVSPILKPFKCTQMKFINSWYNYGNNTCDTKIEAVFRSVVEFIEWYNSSVKK